MEIETLFTGQRWNILKSLSEKKYSPTELAARLDTTINNISQQLRLLELAGLVRKEKIPNRDKGQPRVLYSLSDDYVYLVSVMDGSAKKRLLKLTDYHKILLRIWLIEDLELHYYLSKFYYEIEPFLDRINAMAINLRKLEVIIVSDNKELQNKIKDTTIDRPESRSIMFKIKIVSEKKCPSREGLHLLYDPENVFN